MNILLFPKLLFHNMFHSAVIFSKLSELPLGGAHRFLTYWDLYIFNYCTYLINRLRFSLWQWSVQKLLLSKQFFFLSKNYLLGVKYLRYHDYGLFQPYIETYILLSINKLGQWLGHWAGHWLSTALLIYLICELSTIFKSTAEQWRTSLLLSDSLIVIGKLIGFITVRKYSKAILYSNKSVSNW